MHLVCENKENFQFLCIFKIDEKHFFYELNNSDKLTELVELFFMPIKILFYGFKLKISYFLKK